MRDFIARIRGVMFSLWCRWARKNVKTHGGLRIYKKLKIRGKGCVELGSNCVIDGILGDDRQYVTIDTQSETASIKIGNNVTLCAARISSRYSIVIGNDVLVEESGIIDTDFHSIKQDRGDPLGENLEKCRVVIGDRVCIGPKSFIAKGVRIGEDVVAAPGSIVASSIKPGVVICGNPARPMS